MKKPVLIACAALAAVLVFPRAVKGWSRMSDRDHLQRIVNQLHLPHALGGGTTETQASLGDHALITRYSLEQTFESDDATRDAFFAMVKKVACDDPTPREFLARGYSLDRTYDFPTPRGPGQFHMVITPVDCGIRP